MGLLDGFLNDEGSRLALGLLAAGGPTTDPNKAGFGARLQDAIGSVDQWKQQKAKDAFMKMQMDNYASEIEQRKAAAQKQAFIQDFIQKKLMGDGTSGAGLTQAPKDVGMGGGSGLTFGGVGGNAGGASPIPANANPGGLSNMSPDDLAVLKLNGVDLTDVYKLTRPNLTNVNGTLVDTTDSRNVDRFMPDPDKGKSFNPKTGRVGVLPGFLEAQSAIEGGKADAQEAAKAKYDLTTYTPAGGANPVLTSRSSVLQGSGYAGGSSAAAADGQRQILEKELRNPNNTPADIAAIQREIARLPSNGGIPVQSEAEKQRLVKTAEADVVRDTDKQKAAKMYGQMQMGVDRAIDLLKRGPTHSGIGSAVDTGLGAFGVSTNGGNVASQLDTLSGWLTANVPRMEGPQSDRDVANYRIMAGTVGDRTKPIDVRMAAAQELKNLQEKYAELNGYAKPQDKPASNPNVVNELPKTAPVGSRARDTVTGKVMRFDGLKWKAE